MASPARTPGRRLIAALVLAMALLATACSGSDALTVEPESREAASREPGSREPGLTSEGLGSVDSCEPFPSFSEGSFYIDTGDDGAALPLADTLPGASGSDLVVRLVVVNAEDCSPLGERDVQIWSAAPDGRYSGVQQQPDGDRGATTDERWLRGHQTTDVDGRVEFVTVVPGWIPGQAPHLHVTVPFDDDRAFTARLVVPDEVSNEVYLEAAYVDRGVANVTAATEVERDPSVEKSVIEVTRSLDGYEAEIVLAISEAELRQPPLSAVPANVAPSDDMSDAPIDGPTRDFDQIGGELQEMFVQAASDLGLEPERLYGAFRFVTSESPPDLASIAKELGVTEDALGLALPLLAGGVPTPSE